TAQFKEIVDGLRAAFSDAAITTDIMVGFPDETDDEFNATVEFIRKVSFADAHVFQYSQRRGTPAAKRAGQISPSVKEVRSKIIIDETRKTRDEFLSRFVGQTMRVLFEQPVKGGFFEGKTDNYITVRVKSSEHLNDEFRSVILDTITDGIAYGKIKEDIV
ncbi:MAG: tRNA (N(6)-L-threonylcarbamoyladenosine(37)-C(2))-methylthiotransferase MtaB, partial [Clostridia bacterium]|nr:tRNA (N(6)-L-threonylcarbamoyladenosine(37)-C(2))-methylthiotransferase MtaB [Clostridia bacterium]